MLKSQSKFRPQSGKKITYITLFTLLGVLISFLLHAVIEIPVIFLLVSDFGKWGMGLSWETWEMIHNIGAIILVIIGAWIGFKKGIHWWNVIYVNVK